MIHRQMAATLETELCPNCTRSLSKEHDSNLFDAATRTQLIVMDGHRRLPRGLRQMFACGHSPASAHSCSVNVMSARVEKEPIATAFLR